jgi:hypothetical protein
VGLYFQSILENMNYNKDDGTDGERRAFARRVDQRRPQDDHEIALLLEVGGLGVLSPAACSPEAAAGSAAGPAVGAEVGKPLQDTETSRHGALGEDDHGDYRPFEAEPLVTPPLHGGVGRRSGAVGQASSPSTPASPRSRPLPQKASKSVTRSRLAPRPVAVEYPATASVVFGCTVGRLAG